jgi:hypothetical protein
MLPAASISLLLLMYVPQVFKTKKGGWSKVLNMRNMTDSGQPCSSNVTEPCRKFIHV